MSPREDKTLYDIVMDLRVPSRGESLSPLLDDVEINVNDGPSSPHTLHNLAGCDQEATVFRQPTTEPSSHVGQPEVNISFVVFVAFRLTRHRVELQKIINCHNFSLTFLERTAA